MCQKTKTAASHANRPIATPLCLKSWHIYPPLYREQSHVQPKNPWTSGLSILLHGHIPIQVQATDLAPHLLSSLHPIELPRTDPTLVFHILVRAIEQNKPPLSSGQPRSVDGMEPKWFNRAVPHRLLPFGAVRSGGETKSVANDDMAGFMDHGLTSILLRRPGPQRNGKANSGSEGDVAIARISKPSGESRIPFDNDHLGQFRHLVAFASEPDPTSDVLIVQDGSPQITLGSSMPLVGSEAAGGENNSSACCRACSW